MTDKAFSNDVVIIGAGPVGLAMAAALSRLGLTCCVVEKQGRDAVSSPADDGREIALTHRSVAFLKRLDIWPLIAAYPLGQIRTAHVLNKRFASPLSFASAGTEKDRLSFMVPNYVIRKAVYEAASKTQGVEMIFGHGVSAIETTDAGGSITLDDGRVVNARLVVAADSRFSSTREMMGIGYDKLDFNKVMILAKMAHPRPHHDTAYEWFQQDRTLAMLPLHGNFCSAVLTVDKDEARPLLALDDSAYAQQIETWFEGRHGSLTLHGKRHAYPLVATYARSFSAPSFILAGDAAVGMHPVTAHGFNFGLRGVETLATLIEQARARGQDFAAPHVLAHYQRLHRIATRPLYVATNFIATLFTRRDPVSGLVRQGLHGLAGRFSFARRIISRNLVDIG